jgi:hypothetical protein
MLVVRQERLARDQGAEAENWFDSSLKNAQCLAVMQPTFLPWAGFFNLIEQADYFVFLDDVQLEKQSWQTRNRLILAGQVRWVIVPVRHHHLSQTIAETEVVDTSHWRDKLARGVSLNYGRHPYYADAREVIDYLLAQADVTHLAGLNEKIIRFIASRLRLECQFYRASELRVDGARSNRLAALCKHFGAQEYLSPIGSAQYLEEDGFVTSSSSLLRFQEYKPQSYLQKGMSEFHSHLSIVDVIANLGWEQTGEYIRKG